MQCLVFEIEELDGIVFYKLEVTKINFIKENCFENYVIDTFLTSGWNVITLQAWVRSIFEKRCH